jgi:hypothetical protein
LFELKDKVDVQGVLVGGRRRGVRTCHEVPEKRKYVPLCIDILDYFSIFKRKGASRLKFYNSNKYKVSYYIDNEKIEHECDDNNEDNDTDNKKKLKFIEDD